MPYCRSVSGLSKYLVYKKSSRFPAKSHVDVLGTVIKITLAVDERSAFGPGTFSTLKVCSHFTARKAIQYGTNTYRYVIGAEQLHSLTEIAPKSLSLERFSFECRKVIGFALSTRCDWLKRFALPFHPIRSKTKANCDALACIFPRFASATCNYFEF